MAKSEILAPGIVLKEQFLDVYQLTPGKIAADLGISQSAIRQIISGKGKITLTMALRLGKYFSNTAKYWLDLQYEYDLAELKKDVEFNKSLKEINKAKKPSVSKSTKRTTVKTVKSANKSDN
jgi:addiction module HigA family antidote